MNKDEALRLARWLDDQMGGPIYATIEKNPSGAWVVYICALETDGLLAEITKGYLLSGKASG